MERASAGCNLTSASDAMPVAQRWAYFDHAAVAPVSGPAAALNMLVFGIFHDFGAEGVAMGPEARERAFETARDAMTKLAA